MSSLSAWMIALTLSIIAIIFTAALNNPTMHIVASGLVSVAFAMTAIREHNALQAAGASKSAIGSSTARHVGLVWAWGGLGIFVTYGLILENRWPEWWVFFLAFLIAAIASLVFSNMLDRDTSAGRVDKSVMSFGRALVILQLAGVIGGIISMLIDGKFPRAASYPDWAACNIFFFGALAIAAISLNALRSGKRRVTGWHQQKTSVGAPCRPSRVVVAGAAASLCAITFAALTNSRLAALLAAASFAAVIIAAGYQVTAAHVHSSPQDDEQSAPMTSLDVLRATTCLSAITCAWAAAALLLAYPFAGLQWRHGWEYGLAFALVTSGFAHYRQWLAQDFDAASEKAAVSRAAALATLQGVAISLTIAWILATGKLHTLKNDWLANDVFLATGCAMLALSAFLVTRVRANQS